MACELGDLQETGPESLKPYEPGIKNSEIVIATLARFLPASFVSTLAIIGVTTGFTFAPEVVFLPLMGAPVLVGFGVGLGILRKRLYPDANVCGRRSVIAGILVPFAAISVFMALEPLFNAGVIGAGAMFGSLALIGVLLALLMFFAWLTPTPEELRPDGWIEVGADEAHALPDDTSLSI